MTGYNFRAPTLFELSATPGQELRDVLHDAEGVSVILAQSEKFARWLVTEMRRRGLDTGGPFIDESGWILQTKSGGGFVICIISSELRGNAAWYYMLISRFEGATGKVDRIVESILKKSKQVVDLEIERH